MILFVGLHARGDGGREAFQEIDLPALFGPVAKWAAVIDRADRVPEIVSRAFHTTTSGRPGPVVLGLPEDMLVEQTAAGDVAPYRAVEPAPGTDDLARLAALLAEAERPVMLVGGGGWSAGAGADVARFAETWGLPVATSFRCQDYVDDRCPAYVGDLGIGPNPDLAQAVREADLLLVLGARLGEMTTGGYTLLTPPEPAQRLIHIHPDPEEPGRVYRPTLGICASSVPTAAALAGLAPPEGWRPANDPARLRASFLAWQKPAPMPGDVHWGEIVAWLADRLPDDALVCNGAGNYAGWIHRHYRFRGWRTQLAPTNGSMGYGVPAAIAAKRAHPDRIVVAAAGDGCFLMNGQELATAAQYGIAPIVLVIDNGMYGTIRMHQERDYPHRAHGTALANPDFAALARAYGCHGERVERTQAFADAFERALASGRPALLHLPIDPDAITHRTTISAMHATRS